MKASIKDTPFTVEVELHFESGRFIGFMDSGNHVYLPGELEFEKEFDWETYRKEVAKDVLAGMVANEEVLYGIESSVNLAIEYTDELIRQLKKKQLKKK